MIGWHSPSGLPVLAMAQDSQVPPQVAPQQTPSTQLPELQSPPPVQGLPFERLPPQLPSRQAFGETQSPAPAQVVLQPVLVQA